MVVEDIVFFQLGGVKIHVAARDICGAVVKQARYHFDIFGNAMRCGLDYLGLFDVQFGAVLKKLIRIKLRYLHNGFVLTLCAFEHFILACVRVRRKVSHVGYIHCALNVYTRVIDIFFENVFHYIRTQVSDMRKMIYGRTAGVHSANARFMSFQLFFFMGKRIVKIYHHSFFSNLLSSARSVSICACNRHSSCDTGSGICT